MAATASAALGAIRTAALRHVRPAATALPAERGGAELDQIGGRNARHQVVGDADGDGALAVLALQHQRDDARAGALLFLRRRGRASALASTPSMTRPTKATPLTVSAAGAAAPLPPPSASFCSASASARSLRLTSLCSVSMRSSTSCGAARSSDAAEATMPVLALA